MTTYLCDNGHHGTSERRYASTEPGRAFSGMYTGECAGTVRTIAGDESECSCDCHAPSFFSVGPQLTFR